MTIVLLGCVIALLYVYAGYFAIARFVSPRTSPARSDDLHGAPSVTVLITAFNEQAHIGARLENILSCTYQKDRLDIVVASDGSTDGTDQIVLAYGDRGVRLFRPSHRSGKSATQNEALNEITADVVVFTDAKTEFSRSFLKEIIRPFSDAHVGCVDGHLLFKSNDATDNIATSQGYYWRQELKLRAAESALGLLVVASGACMAVRRRLIKPLPATVGEDCVIPLDVARQGFKTVHAATALAFDVSTHGAQQEFATRVRMTSRNWQGTWMYTDLLNPLRHPGLALSLWSHKILRWLSPFFLLGWCACSVIVLVAGRAPTLLGLPGAAFLVLSLGLTVAPPTRGTLGLRFLWAFIVANAGFAVGVLRGVSGVRITTYR